MFRFKALALTVSKTAFAFLPILLAPIFLGTSVVLVEFYKLQLGLSIVAAVGSLGLGTFVYALAARPNWSYADRLDLIYSILLFKAVSTLLFLAGCIFSISFYWCFSNPLYFKYVLLIPFAYFFVEQQIRLAKQHFFQAFISFAMPPLIFLAILLVTYALSDIYFNEVCWMTFGVVDLVILRLIDFRNFKRVFGLRWQRLKKYLLKPNVIIQVTNGIITYICPPVVTLILISWLEHLNFDPQVIAAYYLYTRAIDAFISLLITYFAAGHIQKIIYRKRLEFSKKQIFFSLSILCALYFSINYVVYYLVNYTNFLMAALEMSIGLVKFCLAIFTLLAIKKFPKIIGAKELFITLSVYLLSLLFVPENIYFLQASILMTFLTALAILSLMMRLKLSTSIAWLK
jgi:hypothetical protein